MTHVATTVPARLAARAVERPDDVALEVVGGGRLRLGDWDRRSNAAARGLLALEVRPGDRVVLACDGAGLLDVAVAYVAIHRAGAVAVPVLHRAGEHQVRRVAEQARAVGVVAPSPIDGAPGWAASTAELERDRSTEPSAPRASAHDDAEVLFTSGTTGTPRGVVASHENILSTHTAEAVDQPVHIVLHALPPASLAGQGLLLQPLDGRPHRVVALPEYSDAAFVDAVHRYRPTHVVLVPALALSLIHSQAARHLEAGSVRAVRTISAPIAPAALERLAALFPAAALFNMYTSTEAFPARVRIRFDPARPTSVGRADAGLLRIVNDEGEPVPAGTAGRVELRSAHAPQRRYLDDDAATAAVFRDDGWVRTGDVGRVDQDGYLVLLDRNQDLIISGGLNISTIEVEAAMHEVVGVREVAVVGLPHPVLGEYVAAAVVPGAGFDRDAVNDHLAERLGAARAPKRLVVLERLPRNELGKVLKRRLRDDLVARAADPARATTAGRDGSQEAVRRIWEEVLDTSAVGWSDDFLALGGTSLTAAAVVARVRTELGRQVRQRDLFETADLGEFAARAAAAAPAAPDRRRIQRVERGA